MAVAVTTSEYALYETIAYSYLVDTMKLSRAIACGVLANIEAESGFNPKKQGDFNDKTKRFESYGLLQWNNDRYDSLTYWCTQHHLNHREASSQMKFMEYECKNSEKTSWSKVISNKPNTLEGAKSAAYDFCVYWERPSDKEQRGNDRSALVEKYWNFYIQGHESTIERVESVGEKIVAYARDQIDKPYASGTASGPDNYSAMGLVYASYRSVGSEMPMMNVQTCYDKYKSTAKSVSMNSLAPGDLLFYYGNDSKTLGIIAIATGEGTQIFSEEGKKVVEIEIVNSPVYALRLLPDAEAYASNSPSSGESYSGISSSANHVSVDNYDALALSNLSKINETERDYGYLFDLTHPERGAFKFYIPDFSESAGANWNNINIIGRSVSIQAYESTNSRKITVSLELYAGAGLYNIHSIDIVGKMHSDINFIKSLEYPDYTTTDYVNPPSTVQLVLGSAVELVGVVSGVSVEHLRPIDSQGRAMYVKLSFTVTQTAKNPPDYKDIRDNQYAEIDTDNLDTLLAGDEESNAPGLGMESNSESERARQNAVISRLKDNNIPVGGDDTGLYIVDSRGYRIAVDESNITDVMIQSEIQSSEVTG